MRRFLSISSFKLYMKRFLVILILIVSLCKSWGYYCKLVQYPRNSFYDFYEVVDDDTVDVLCIGSSHIFCGINPIQLYNDYGIAAYDLAAGSQAIWNSYYYIKEALKTQTPKLIVLDVYLVPTDTDYFDGNKTEANLINMPISLDKWNALEVSESDNRSDVFWNFPITHMRYSSLDKHDFCFDGNMNTLFMGYRYRPEIVPYNTNDVLDVRYVDGEKAVPQKNEEYLRKCIELCQEQGIEILLTNTPWPEISEDLQLQYNYINEIAEEYNVPFINGCLQNHEFDWSTDSMGDGGHLNYNGVTKWTRILGDYLEKNYDLPDRRGDNKYSAWTYQSKRLDSRIRKQNIQEASDLNEVMNVLTNIDNLCCVIEVRGDYKLEDMEIPSIVMGNIEIDLNSPQTYVIRNREIYEKKDANYDYEIGLWQKGYVLTVSNVSGVKEIRINDSIYGMVNNGINIVIYDELLNEVVGKIGIDADDEYNMVKWKCV